MAFFDIFKKGSGGPQKKADKLKRPPKGALKQAESRAAAVEDKAKEAKKEKAEIKLGKSELASMVILKPHVTEKTTIGSESGAYTFVVSPRANKILVKRAVRELYGFTPKRVRMINIPAKPRRVRGVKGTKSGYKKAVVYLKENDKIEIS